MYYCSILCLLIISVDCCEYDKTIVYNAIFPLLVLILAHFTVHAVRLFSIHRSQMPLAIVLVSLYLPYCGRGIYVVIFVHGLGASYLVRVLTSPQRRPNNDNIPIVEAAMQPVPVPSLDDSFFLADGSHKPSVAKVIPRTPLQRKIPVEEKQTPPTPAQRNVDQAFMNLSSSDAWAPSPQPAPKIDLGAYKRRRQSMGRRGPRYSNIFPSANPLVRFAL